ncbi:hypothetical protein AC1031_002418 [Aphanomyces cochlioides]|nr:hypothetical protein AC1031_002418 [Aphanomyces cochlioides]
MSGFIITNPSIISNTYNPAFYSTDVYLRLSDPRVGYISNLTPGQAGAKKAIVLDSSKNISGINSIGLLGTSDSASTSTGSITTAGGLGVAKTIYCAAQSIVNGTSQITLNSSSNSAGRSTVAFQNDSSTFEFGCRGTTNGTYNNEMYIYNGGYLWHMNALGWTYYLATQDATSSTIGGAMTIAGGCGIAKKLYVGSHASITGSLLVGTSTDTTRAISALNSNLATSGNQYITFGQSATNNNQAEMSFFYSASGSTSNRIDFGFYGSARFFQIQANGQVSCNGTDDATSSTAGGALTSLGGFACQKKLFVGTSASIGTSCTITTAMNSATATIGSSSNTTGTLSITSVGYHIGCFYNATNLTLLNTGSSGNFVISPQTGATSTTYTFAPDGSMQLSGITPRNSHKMDLGTNTSKDNILCLAQTNNTSPSYMLGVSSSSLNYTSGGDHAFYNNTSSTPAILGSERMRLTSAGNLNIANGGVHCYGLNAGDLVSTGPGMHMHYSTGSSVGILQCFDYSASQYKDIAIQSTLFYKSSNGFWGLGTNAPTCPFHVQGTATQSTASGFGYLNGSGAGGASGFSNRPFSILTSGGILCQSGEIDVLSDVRLKQDITNIDSDLADQIEPIAYAYRSSPESKHYGYSAQELVKYNHSELVGYTGADEPLEEQVIECENGNMLSLPSDTRLVVNLLHMIPLLHRALKRALERIDEQQIQINELLSSPKRTRAKKNYISSK